MEFNFELHAKTFERKDGKFIAAYYDKEGKVVYFNVFDTEGDATSGVLLVKGVLENIFDDTKCATIIALISEMAKDPQKELENI